MGVSGKRIKDIQKKKNIFNRRNALEFPRLELSFAFSFQALSLFHSLSLRVRSNVVIRTLDFQSYSGINDILVKKKREEKRKL